MGSTSIYDLARVERSNSTQCGPEHITKHHGLLGLLGGFLRNAIDAERGGNLNQPRPQVRRQLLLEKDENRTIFFLNGVFVMIIV